MPRPRIVVIGSINMDLVLRVPRLPDPGETLAGDELLTVPGGKGANQAVAAARLGGRVHMVGRVGDDAFGPELRKGLERYGVDTRFVKTTRGSSGVAMILVQAGGENSILLSGGANQRVTIADVKAARPVIEKADAVLLQLEIPIAVVVHAIKLCKRLGVPVILDPAPAVAGLPKEVFDVDVLSPNETEARLLLGTEESDPFRLAHALMKRGVGSVVLKRGAEGSLQVSRGGSGVLRKAFKVKVVDTTAAGDAATAGLAIARAEGKDWADALRFANAAGALACTKLRAQPSIPTRGQVDRLVAAYLRKKKTHG